MAKNLNHYAVVLFNKNGSAHPASTLFFSNRQEAVNAFLVIKGMKEKESLARVYVLPSAIPVESRQIHSLMELCLETNEWLRHGWVILTSEFSEDKVLNEYTEPITNDERALVNNIVESLRGMSSARAALIMKTITDEYFLDATFES